jgi:uroporphyrinogen III methyltransferase/synthase
MKNPAVYLIGTGPGDPGLITVHGLECLRNADVVIHDQFVPARLLTHARPGAELINVGSAARQPMAQEAISLLIAEKAREGRLVARLKRGDPFVFDRGGEEALFLHENDIPFEVVPGIPLGIGVPAYAGVPVTYPGGGDTITLVRGYEDESRTLPVIDWASLARLEGTIVCYAGAQQLPRMLDAMQANGWPGDDPAVIVYNGTLTSQETVSGTILELLDRVREHPRRGPAILVVGRVVGFREHLRWFDTRPLFGKRVLVTRPRDQAAEMVDRLTVMGAEAIEAPMIRIMPPHDPDPVLRAAASAADFDWIVFTSANAVESFMTAFLDGTRDIRSLKGPRLCTVGSGTAERLGRYGIKVDLIPDEFRAEAVVTAMTKDGSIAGASVLVPRADIGRDVIADGLRAAGAIVTDVVAYRTVLEEAQQDGGPDI